MLLDLVLDIDRAEARRLMFSGLAGAWWPVLALPAEADDACPGSTEWRWIARPRDLVIAMEGGWRTYVELHDPEPAPDTGAVYLLGEGRRPQEDRELWAWRRRTHLLAHFRDSLTVPAWQYVNDPPWESVWREPLTLGRPRTIAARAA